ncbi:metal-dependent hydrolase, beta-lactamase superfamily I [Synechococcus sp. PCC 7502]|uniref:MBL fold metallo-hydrolase n=1 Tax=Synechococcus sp. PCC 7502 TaxID=1173263 RepID=UPI00029F9EEA|nr:MBL fold metallo-hydrolase [Synechococcus sp. PCC 7502]AFY73429.1 metal-dependent hydrolase, beta-lactamase superfamily I [Synechococcus sp. PCC 7502]
MPISEKEFSVHFWGVRGSIATPGVGTVRYGGNTPCVEIRCHGKRLIMDGGTGIRALGQYLLKEMPVEGHIFFTHSHWDHIQGFPFFIPAFIKGNTFDIYGRIAPNGATLQERLEDQMHHPNFPVPLRIMGSTMKFHNIEIGEKIDLGDGVIVETGMLNHPGEATGYRVCWDNYAIVYATDTEHFADGIDQNLVNLARNADVLILDATYSDEQYWSKVSPKVGWGHSTWQEAIKVAESANVKTLVIYHHDPLHDDDYLDEVGKKAKEQFPGAIMAREGMVLSLTA